MAEFKPGDRIRYKKEEGETYRLNGALDLTLNYLGTDHVIYTWTDPDGGSSKGEVHIPRDRFDREIEAVPVTFEQGRRYRHKVSGAEYDCLFADEVCGLLKALGPTDGPGRSVKNQAVARFYEQLS